MGKTIEAITRRVRTVSPPPRSHEANMKKNPQPSVVDSVTAQLVASSQPSSGCTTAWRRTTRNTCRVEPEPGAPMRQGDVLEVVVAAVRGHLPWSGRQALRVHERGAQARRAMAWTCASVSAGERHVAASSIGAAFTSPDDAAERSANHGRSFASPPPSSLISSIPGNRIAALPIATSCGSTFFTSPSRNTCHRCSNAARRAS